LEAPEATLLARLKARGKDASDATADVLQRQLTYDSGPIDWIRVDADRATDDIVSDVRSALRS
jgi:predicted kinase